MKAFLKSVVAGLLAVLLTLPAAMAQNRPAFSAEELDQMLAPIALYPDPLLTQILMAATYPLEVVQAARWSRANPNVKGQDAVRAVESMDWDPSVKSLVAFPQVLHRMDEQLDWTQRLGEAFLDQEPHVMDAIQGLRLRAERAGNLQSSEQMRVTRQDGHIVIEPAHPQVVYVPYYDPAVVYGPWWWPAYPPVYWGPPLGYYAWGAYAPGFYWGPAIAFSWGFFFGHADWHHRHVSVVHGHPHQPAHGMPYGKPVKWQHDPVHRRNVPYRHTVSRQPFGQPLATRGDDRARPTVRRESHDTEPRARGVTQQMRPQFAAPQSRPEHNAPQARDRLPDRAARAEIQRPQSRVPDPRPAAAVPRAAPAPRPFTPAPVARAEPRPAPPAANSRVIPRQQPVPSPRAELPAPARAGSMIPRAAANAPSFVPRMDGNSSRSIARPHAGTVRERPAASHGSRHSNRRS